MEVDASQAAPLREIARIDVGKYPGDVAYGEGAAWVTNYEGDLLKIDPATNDVVSTIPILREDDNGTSIDEGGQDSGTRPDAGLAFGALTVGEGSVWVTAHGCTLFKVDPVSERVVSERHLRGCYRPIVAEGGSVWLGVANGAPGSGGFIARLDPETLETQAEVPIGVCCVSGMAYEQGALWVGRQDVGNWDGSTDDEEPTASLRVELLRIDPASNTVSDSIPLKGHLYRAGDTVLSDTITAGNGAVWLTRPEAGSVDRIELTEFRVTEMPFDSFDLPDYPVILGDDVVVSELNGPQLAVIDATGEDPIEILDTGSGIGSIASDGESLWILHPKQRVLVRLSR
ncbi:MAG TPA: hypothetical protein VEV82_00010 [Actinomycetota bacterium]|nr:hypothetical protein [Actinomycetota bacterium]